MEEEEQDDFIVSDGHLSVYEYDFSQDGNIDEVKKLEEIKLRREKIKQQKNQQIAEGKSYAIVFESPCEAEEFKILALPISSIK